MLHAAMLASTQLQPHDGAEPPRPPRPRWPLALAALLAVVGVGAIAIAALGPGEGPGPDDVDDAVAAEIDVDGEPLPPFEDPSSDQAIGMPAPGVEGTGVDGEPIALEPGDGEPKVVLFVAHWCPVCTDEVPEVQQAVEDGRLRDDVELLAVSTGVREGEANYPPGQWLAEEGWTVPTIIDNSDSNLAGAYGLQAYPYWVFIDADGGVAGRLSGALPMDGLQQLMDELAARA